MTLRQGSAPPRRVRCLRAPAAVLLALLVFAPGRPVTAGEVVDGAACSGDCNGDGRVGVDELVRGVNIALRLAEVDLCAAMDRNDDGQIGINELVTAVGNALEGCPCPFDFAAEQSGGARACAFVGRWNRLCGDAALPAVFSVQSGLLGVAVVTGPESPLLTFFAQPLGERQASLVGFTYDGDAVQIGGLVILSDDGRRLEVAPDAPTGIVVRDCDFVTYDGSFVRIVTGNGGGSSAAR